ncbi:MAG: hypothetical protein AAF614_41035 [Chloroflexota bacterium]
MSCVRMSMTCAAFCLLGFLFFSHAAHAHASDFSNAQFAVNQSATTGSITIINQTNPAGGANFLYYGDLGTFFLDDGQSQVASAVSAGDVTVRQSIPVGWQLQISCTGGSVTTLADGVTIHLAVGDAIACTFANSDVGGSITIVTATSPAGGSGVFYFGSLGSFTLDDGQSRLSDNLLPGDFTILQSIPAGWTLSVSCTGGDFTLQAAGVIVHLEANEDIVCTFSNTDVGGSITIVNATNPAGGTGFFYFGNLGSFTLDDGQSHVAANQLPGDFTISQTIPTGWTLSVACTGGDFTLQTAGVTVHLEANEDIVCTFTNSDVGGSIAIVNATVPSGGSSFDYFGTLGNFSLDDGQTEQANNLLPGAYEITQTVPPGWLLTVSCVGGDSTPLTNGVQVQLDAGENVVCTFTNTDVGGSITVVNETIPSGGTSFSYAGDLGVFSLNDGETRADTDLYPGSYTVSQAVTAPWELSIACVGGDFTVAASGNSVEIQLDANEDIVCTFTNTDVGGSITILNVADPVDSTDFGYFGDLGTFSLMDDESQLVDNLYPGDYSVQQATPAGWVVVVDCLAADKTVISQGVTLHLSANEDVTCTFENVFIGGTITILVESDPIGGQDFTLLGTLGTFDLNDGESRTFSGLTPGVYAITENPSGNWVLDTAVCDNGQDTRTGVDVATNDDWTCTFSNIPGPTTVLLRAIEANASTLPDLTSLAVVFTMCLLLIITALHTLIASRRRSGARQKATSSLF